MENLSFRVLPQQLEETAKTHLSSGILRRVEYEKPIADRTDKDLIALIEQYVLQPSVLRAWGLWASLTKQGEINEYLFDQGDAVLTFKSWLTIDFLFADQSANPLYAGIRTACSDRFGSFSLPSCLRSPSEWVRPSTSRSMQSRPG